MNQLALYYWIYQIYLIITCDAIKYLDILTVARHEHIIFIRETIQKCSEEVKSLTFERSKSLPRQRMFEAWPATSPTGLLNA